MVTRKLTCLVALLVPLLGGCAQGVGVGLDDDGSVEGPVAGLSGYDFRAPLELEDVPDDVSVRLTFDHAALVEAGTALADGADLRVVFTGDDGVTKELDRVIDRASEWDRTNTSVFFRSQPVTGSYHVYYGNPDADEPLDDPAAVFEMWDDFDILGADWSVDEIGDATNGDASVVDGSVRVAGITGDIGGTEDNLVYLNRPVSGDFRVEVEIAGVGGSLGGSAKLGGVMVRQSAAPDSRHLTVSLLRSPRARATYTRQADGGETTAQQLPAPETFPQYFRVERVGALVTAQYSEDGMSYVGLGSAVDLGMTDPVLVGIPIANISGGSGHVDVDWFRVREAVLPEPKAVMGEEELNN